MNLRRKTLWCGVIVLAALALVVWMATRRPESATMANGAVVTLQKVTRGKEHRFVYGSLWQRLTAKLPEKWFGKSGARVLTHRTTNDSVVVWLVWKGKPETLLMRSVPGYVVVNERDERVMIVGSA